jgi:hypothetical protein
MTMGGPATDSERCGVWRVVCCVGVKELTRKGAPMRPQRNHSQEYHPFCHRSFVSVALRSFLSAAWRGGSPIQVSSIAEASGGCEAP